MKQNLKSEKKEDWIVPISPDAYKVANLMSEDLGIKDYISIAICTMAVEQIHRLQKQNHAPIPKNVVIAINELTKRVKKLG